MRTIILVIVGTFAAIIGVLLLAGVLNGIWDAVGVIPRWIWLVGLFLFVAFYFFSADEKKSCSYHTAAPSNKKDAEAEAASSHKDPFDEAVKRMRTPVRVVAVQGIVEAAIDSPILETHKSCDTKQMARIQLIQQIRKSPLLGSACVTCRYAEIITSVEELQRKAAIRAWREGAVLPGKIVRIETFYPKWNGHQPLMNNDGVVKGITYLGDFYPIYESYQYTEDENAVDRTFSIEDLIRSQGQF